MPEDSGLHDAKLNRTLRFCGNSKEQCINSANICLIGATAVGCAVLTKLIAEGIRSFTIIDKGLITRYDKGTNFFLKDCPTNEGRAVAATKKFLKMNKNVRGNYLTETFEKVLETDIEFFKKFHLVFASNLSEKQVLHISNQLWNDNVAFVYSRSLGFFATLRFQVKYQAFFNKTENNEKLYDLRLHKPFPALQDFLERSQPNSNVSWMVLIMSYLKVWQNKQTSEGQRRLLPSTLEEQKDLANFLLESNLTEEKSFESTLAAVKNVLNYTGEVTKNIQYIFHVLDKLQETNDELIKDIFWILMTSLKSFSNSFNQGMLPVNGVLPEVHINPKVLTSIRNIYEHQSLQDANDIFEKCLSKIKAYNLPGNYIQYETVLALCRQLHKLELEAGTSISNDYQQMPFSFGVYGDSQFYFALRTYERFLDVHGRAPNAPDPDEAQLFRDVSETLVTPCRSSSEILEEVIYEICDYRGGELRSVATAVAEIVSQKTMLFLTNQYIDIKSTFLYNGIVDRIEPVEF